MAGATLPFAAAGDYDLVDCLVELAFELIGQCKGVAADL